MSSPESVRILVIEDDSNFRALLKGMLEDEGYTVLGAESGEAALALAEQETFDLVIADVKLGGIDGLDTLAQLKQGRNELQSLVITGYATEADSIRAISLGVGNYLKKPFKMADFLRAVHDMALHLSKERAKAERDAAVLDTALWGLEHLAKQLSSNDDSKNVVDIALQAERVGLKKGLSDKDSRNIRLALLARAVKASELGGEVPFLLKILPEQVDWLLRSLQSPKGAGESIEEKIARLAVLSTQGSIEDSEEEELSQLFSKLEGEAEDLVRTSSKQSNFLALAKALEASGDISAAWAAFAKVEDQGQLARSTALLNKAHLDWTRGQREAALAHLESAQLQALGFAANCEVKLKGGILLTQMKEMERAEDWLQAAVDGYKQLQKEIESAQAQLALAGVTTLSDETFSAELSLLLNPSNLEVLLCSANWLYPLLLRRANLPESRRALQRLTRDLPQLVSRILETETDPELLKEAIQFVAEVGGGAYEDFLQELMLHKNAELRKSAQLLLESSNSLKLAPTLRLYSLGPFSTWVGQRRIPDKGWTGRVPSKLLSFLAQNSGSFHCQEQLIDIFWQEAKNGRKALNQALFALRTALRDPEWPEKIDYISRRGTTVGINPEETCWHDVGEMEKALKEGSDLLKAQQSVKAADKFERAMELDRGEYLEGAFEDWALNFRESLSLDLSRGLLSLAEIRLDQGKPDEALIASSRVMEKDAFSTPAVELSLRAHLALKQAEKAISLFEKVEFKMRHELQLEPSTDCIKLYHIAKMALSDRVLPES